MTLIDEAGARSIANWFKEGKDIPHTVTLKSETPLNINVENDRELATLKIILMRNRIKYSVDDLMNISPN